MVVIDASIVVELLLRSDAGLQLEARLLAYEGEMHAPFLLDIEILQAFRRQQNRGAMSESQGRRLVGVFTSLPILRYPHGPLLPRIWQLRHNLSAYDATYVALAEGLGAPLLTCDAGIANAPGHTAIVELIPV